MSDAEKLTLNDVYKERWRCKQKEGPRPTERERESGTQGIVRCDQACVCGAKPAVWGNSHKWRVFLYSWEELDQNREMLAQALDKNVRDRLLLMSSSSPV